MIDTGRKKHEVTTKGSTNLGLSEQKSEEKFLKRENTKYTLKISEIIAVLFLTD